MIRYLKKLRIQVISYHKNYLIKKKKKRIRKGNLRRKLRKGNREINKNKKMKTKKV